MQWFIQILINSILDKLIRPLIIKLVNQYKSIRYYKKKSAENTQAGTNYEENPTIDNANKLP